MEWIKWASASEGGNAENRIGKVYYANTDGNLLAAPACEAVLCEAQGTDAVIRIAENQCAVLAEGGTVLSFCMEAGEYLLRAADAGQNVQVHFVQTGARSGPVSVTANPVPYPAADRELGISGTVHLRCAGCFSYRISRPEIFWQSLHEKNYTGMSVQLLEKELNGVLAAGLSDVFARLSGMGVPYSEVTAETERLTGLMQEKLVSAWKDACGIELAEYRLFLTEANREEEEAFRKQCRQESEKRQSSAGSEDANTSGNPFSSAEWDEAVKEISRSAEEAFGMLQGGISSLLGGIMGAMEKGLDFSNADVSVTSGESGVKRSMQLLGTWECPELKQTAVFALMDAAVIINGQEVWRGSWKETPGEGGAHTVISSDDGQMGGYTYFEYHKPSAEGGEEYLAAVFSDTEAGKQYIRFVKTKGIFEIR